MSLYSLFWSAKYLRRLGLVCFVLASLHFGLLKCDLTCNLSVFLQALPCNNQHHHYCSRIIHPVHDLDLKAVRMLNIYRRDELSIRHNIKSGFIVDQVLRNTTAQKMGIRRGDVIDVMSLELGTTLSEFEDNLLEISWQFLEKELDPILDLQIQVHNLYDGESVCTVLPMRFRNATVNQHDSLEFEVTKK
uniref:PDZ domain-containing protein n=3 Tax=Aegilops tauschii subsp. strangulata TaxID=200361 RepID=A0A453JKB1_AEGTS